MADQDLTAATISFRAGPSHSFIGRLLAAIIPVVVALTACVAAFYRPGRYTGPVLTELHRSGLAAVPLASLLLLAGGLCGTWVMTRARARPDLHAGRAARVPQAVIVTVFSVAAALVAWRAVPAGTSTWPDAALCYALGGAAVVLAFPLLVIERLLAADARDALPEAPALRALAFVAVLCIFLSGLTELAAGAGLPATARAESLIAIIPALAGAELALRALGRLFLPPPDPLSARAACASLVARVIASGAAEGGLAAPLRQHLGIDFSRSWALAYVRSAALPLAGSLGLLAWVLTGIVLVPLDGRAVYERFGAPVRVLHPGLHAILPWPLGAAKRVEFGTVHEVPLGAGAAQAETRVGAEDPAPATADRLWEQAHPGELTLLVASQAGSRQSFQSVSADLRLLYRVGDSDEDALHAAYASADPEALVRSIGGRAIAAYFAARTLPDMLGADREAMADTLCGIVQAELDRVHSGLRMVAVAIEAIHPPAGAADAYHAVRAAEIAASASIAAERGRAIVVRSQSRQYGFEQMAAASAGASETVGAADIALTRFAADRDAAKAGGHAFLLERYFASLSSALGKSPMTIIDHRLNWPEAPVLDLRPLSGAALPTEAKGE